MIKMLNLLDIHAQQHLMMQLVSLSAHTEPTGDRYTLDVNDSGHDIYLFDQFGKPLDRITDRVRYVIANSKADSEKLKTYAVSSASTTGGLYVSDVYPTTSSALEILRVTGDNLRKIIKNGYLYLKDDRYKSKSNIYYPYGSIC